MMFRRGNAIVTVVIDEETGSPMIRDCSEAYIRGSADRAAYFAKEVGGRYVPAEVPREVIQDLMSRPEELPFPRLNGVFESPVAVDSGRVLEQSGYDYQSGFFLVVQSDFELPPMPDCPTREDARIASEFIQNEILTDFPFEDEASKDNVLAALITVVARPAINGPVPIGIIDATSAGTGKSLLNEVIAQIGTGRPAAMKSLPKDEEETRKVITSALMRNPAGMIVFDNLAGSISSAVLAQALTSRNYQDRVLGSSRMVEIPNRCTWFANGNNVDIRGDIARRAYYIRLDSQCTNPWLRNEFRHPNLTKVDIKKPWFRCCRTFDHVQGVVRKRPSAG
jgi:hypothetical protein